MVASSQVQADICLLNLTFIHQYFITNTMFCLRPRSWTTFWSTHFLCLRLFHRKLWHWPKVQIIRILSLSSSYKVGRPHEDNDNHTSLDLFIKEDLLFFSLFKKLKMRKITMFHVSSLLCILFRADCAPRMCLTSKLLQELMKLWITQTNGLP